MVKEICVFSAKILPTLTGSAISQGKQKPDIAQAKGLFEEVGGLAVF